MTTPVRRVKVAAVALNQTPLAWKQNYRNIVDGINAAASAGARVITLPELAITGYGCEKAFSLPDVQHRALEALEKLLPLSAGRVLIVGTPVMFKKALYNTAAVLVDGQLRGFVAKRFLAGDGNHYEQRYFKPWRLQTKGMVDFFGEKVPIGDIMFDIGGLLLGVEICQDAWVSDRPGRRMAELGVDLICSPNASHFAFGKLSTRVDFCRDGSRAFNCGIVYANLLGNESGSMIYAGECLIASGGKLLAQGERFSFKDYVVTTAVIDIEKNRQAQAEEVSFDPDPDDRGLVIEIPNCLWIEQDYEPDSLAAIPAWEASKDIRYEEFSRICALGLWDYLRKSGQHGYAVSLSGGADSCSVVVLLRDMLDLAWSELGPQGIAQRFSRSKWAHNISATSTPQALMQQLLHCFYQPSEASGNETQNSARQVAEGVGAKFGVIAIGELVAKLQAATEGYIGRELSWDNPADDIPLQNFSARTRGIVGWSIANAEGRLLIPPGNMSEIMVGYFTQGGDDSGGVNPIGGVRKTFLRAWLKWREKEGPAGLAPMPFLNMVNSLAPTAELRPTEPGAIAQTDEGELGPYEVRDLMEDLLLWDRLSPIEIRDRLVQVYGEQFPRELLSEWVKKFFWLFSINQWKRERLPVSFHVDDHNLVPRLWLRWPVLSSNFQEELAALDQK